MDGIYAKVFELLGEERRKQGKRQIMKGQLLGRLIKAIDAVLEYDDPKKDEKPK